jgi:predicted nucleic acid-binding protein
MIAAVFDCMVYLQAADNRNGAAGACLGLVEDGHVRLLASSAILDEVEDVLKRPKIRAAFPTLTDDHVADFTEQVRRTLSQPGHCKAGFVPRQPRQGPVVAHE